MPSATPAVRKCGDERRAAGQHRLALPHRHARAVRERHRDDSPLRARVLADRRLCRLSHGRTYAALAPYCDAGEHFYCIAWPGPIGSGWALTADAPGLQLVWDAPVPGADDGFDAVRLRTQNVPAMQALVAMTQPGPFAERTIELGEYYGVFVDGELVAMAGERMGVGTFREISGVCTRPGFQGRGLARRLVEKLVRLQLARGQTPFLHVMADNHNAHRLYQRMGFRLRTRMMLRVIERAA